jgi:hypothetical protein
LLTAGNSLEFEHLSEFESKFGLLIHGTRWVWLARTISGKKCHAIAPLSNASVYIQMKKNMSMVQKLSYDVSAQQYRMHFSNHGAEIHT